MKNSEYWKLRFAQLEKAQNGKAKIAFSEIEQQYKQAQKMLEGQIAVWYQRFADNNKISLAEARQWLKSSDLKELKWDVNDYIKYGKENAVNGQWIKELENASAKFHISKLEALKIQTQQSLEVMFQKQLGTVNNIMQNVFKSGYYHTAYELQKGFNIGWDIAGLDQSEIEKVISKPWAADGYNFSERIWKNKNKLISEIHSELTQNIMTGSDPQKAINSLAKIMNTSKYNAGRLVMTEEAYFSSLSQKECFEDLDVEQYEIVATLDSHTSEICQNLDGKVFPMKDFEPGVTAPPFHVYCRSTTVPHFKSNYGSVGQRAARDPETGKTYYVPANITYPEWYEKFVDGGDKSDLKPIDKSGESGIINTGSGNVALENQRYGRNKDTLVNKSYIESGEYKRKFDKATDNPEVNKTLYDCAKKALQHRSGTVLEDMYWINGDTGKIILGVTDSTTERAIIYTNKIKNAIKDKDDIITLHTHPSSMPPSINDFNSNFKNKYNIGFIACHNGKVFKYAAHEEITLKLYDMYVGDFINDGCEEFEAQIKALEKLKKNYDIIFEEVVFND